MKQLFTKLTVALAVVSALSTNLLAQKADAGVFYLYMRIDETLIDSRKVETTSDRSFLTGYSDRVEVPEELLDSVRSLTNHLVSKKLGVETDMLYLKDKKGRKRATQSMNIFPGMPFVNLGPARKAEHRKYYVKIYVNITPQAKASVKLDPKRSKERPKVEMRVDIYNSDGKRHFSNRVVLRDFEVLRSQSRVRKRIKITESEVLSAEDLVEMYVLALEEALFKE